MLRKLVLAVCVTALTAIIADTAEARSCGSVRSVSYGSGDPVRLAVTARRVECKTAKRIAASVYAGEDQPRGWRCQSASSLMCAATKGRLVTAQASLAYRARRSLRASAAAATKVCQRLRDPSLSRVLARGVSCPLARSTAQAALAEGQSGANSFTVHPVSPESGRRVTFRCTVEDGDIACRRRGGSVRVDFID
jgi:hypothetical protein